MFQFSAPDREVYKALVEIIQQILLERYPLWEIAGLIPSPVGMAEKDYFGRIAGSVVHIISPSGSPGQR
jgi:hypothetical protein